ncbi:MAG TPA: hypothetical protein VM451_00310 [Candidatus Limnocylindria bacterium]|nr:hypothetical protein [Candidatus Limnocylindria bacterium]
MRRRLVLALVIAVACAALADLPLRTEVGDVASAIAAGYIPEGRIAWSDGLGIFAGLRTCHNLQCDDRQLTQDGTDHTPAWSPTGRQLAFSRQVDENHRLLFVLDLPSGTVSQVTRPAPDDARGGTVDTDPDWSPDGGTIVFSRASRAGVQIGFVAATGGGVRLLPADPIGTGPCSAPLTQYQRTDPSFAPDGAHIAYTIDTIFVAGSRAPPRDPILLAGATLPESVTTELAAASCDKTGVWTSGTDGHADEQQVAPELGLSWAPSWSPDGTRIALETNDATYVTPVGGGAPAVALRDNIGNQPHGTSGSGFFGVSRVGRVGWDPAGQFLVIEAPGLSSDIQVKYRPDGTGDIDLGAGTTATHGVAVQCLPGSCLTSFTVVHRIDGVGGAFPAAFNVDGTVHGTITIDDPTFSEAGSLTTKVTAGTATASETPNADWPVTSITCDKPGAQVDLRALRLSVEVAEGETVTCEFLSDRGVTLPTDAVPPESAPADCPEHEAYHGDWAAHAYTYDTLDYQVDFQWCHGNGQVAVVGPITVHQSVGDFFLPDWLTYFSFEAHDQEIRTSALRTSPGTIDVHAEGSFTWCTSVFAIATELLPEFKWLRGIEGSRVLPGFLRKGLVNRIVNPLKSFLHGVIETVGGEKILTKYLSPELAAGYLDEQLKLLDQLINEVVAALLGYAPSGNDPLLALAAPAFINFCVVETWHPDVTITVSADGSSGAVVSLERTSPFWEIHQLAP